MYFGWKPNLVFIVYISMNIAILHGPQKAFTFVPPLCVAMAD